MYPKLENQDIKKELLQVYSEISKDESPSVRRAAADNIKFFCKVQENEERLMEERAALHNADLDEIIDFFPRVVENIKEEIANGLTWEKLVEIPGIEDQINLAEKGINEDLKNYKEEILEIQKEKDAVITKTAKDLELTYVFNGEEQKENSKVFTTSFKDILKIKVKAKTGEILELEDVDFIWNSEPLGTPKYDTKRKRRNGTKIK